MPVLYKPKFCCQCGEAIERSEWKPWTSRRFCDVCESVQKHHDLMPRAVVTVGLIAGLFGISGFMARQSAEPSKPMHIVSAKPAASTANRSQEVPAAANAGTAGRQLIDPAAPNNSANVSIPARIVSAQNNAKPAESETVYFCGAATKKGTPCSRRVKAPGRCWQHTGQPAMISDIKVRPTN